MKMKTKILHNPKEILLGEGRKTSGKDIVDYRVEEAEYDSDGNPVIDSETNRPKWTGKTFEWTIKVGETIEFPIHVADYLKGIYNWLEEVKGKPKGAKEATGEEGGKLNCKFCGKGFKNKRAIGMHTGIVHLDEVVGK